jgi:hypothetical protein
VKILSTFTALQCSGRAFASIQSDLATDVKRSIDDFGSRLGIPAVRCAALASEMRAATKTDRLVQPEQTLHEFFNLS